MPNILEIQHMQASTFEIITWYLPVHMNQANLFNYTILYSEYNGHP